MPRRTFTVTTWDLDRQEYTPQAGLPKGAGPYTEKELPKVLKLLAGMGYAGTGGSDDPCVRIVDNEGDFYPEE